MGVEVNGVEKLLYLLSQGGTKAQKNAFRAMQKEGEEMADLARKMAPIDHGDLEKAIRTRSIGGGRNARGQFTRKEVVIEVDGDQPAGEKGKTVGDYAYLIHEHMAPFGTRYKLGKRSQAKQNGQPNVIVGGGYLERAVAEKEKGLVNRIVRAVSNGLDGLDEDD